MKALRIWGFILTLCLLQACSGGDSPGSLSPPAAVARIEIRPSALILTTAGASKQLTAHTFDADGHEVQAAVAWASTAPAKLSVAADGKVTAVSADGSAQITATAGGVTSPPVLVVATTLPAGAVALTDAQIVGDPVETTPDAAPSFDNTYSVNLSGVATPAVGTLLINTEGKAVAGRVVAVDTSVTPMKVTLGLVSIRELLPNLNLNEVIDMANAPVTINPDIAARYDVKRTGDLFEFTPKPGAFTQTISNGRARALAAAPIVLPALQLSPVAPFDECEGSITGGSESTPTPFTLAAPPVFSVKIKPSAEVIYSAANGLERLLIKASPTVKIEAGVTANVAFEGTVECKVTVFTYFLPPAGVLALLLATEVPVGVGLEFGGKVTAASIGVSLKDEVSAQFFAGFECPPGGDCEFAHDVTVTNKLTPSVTLPGVSNFRFEPSAALFGFAKGQFGNPFLKSLRFKALKAKFGGRLDGSFAPIVTQIADTSYKSDYKASLEASIATDQNLGDVLKLLGIGKFKALELKVTADIGKSPVGLAVAAVTADKGAFVAGDTVNFSIKLDPASVGFLFGVGPYNVKDVVLVRDALGLTAEVGRVTASSGQTDFVIPFVATDSGQVGEFTAFVVTKILSHDPFSLEIGTAAGPAANLAGTWEPTTPGGFCAVLSQNQNAVSGTLQAAGASAALLATLSDSQLLGVSLDGTFEGTHCTASGSGAVVGDSLTITVNFNAPCNSSQPFTFGLKRGGICQLVP